MASNGFKKLMLGMEELGHELKQGDEYFDLLYSYIDEEELHDSSSNINEASEYTQYGVHQFSTNSIIFRGSEEECGKYIDERPELWDDAEVYMIASDDLHYKKNESLYSSDKEYVSKECSYEMAEEIAQKAKRALRLPSHEVEMLEHDINNLRSNEWVDIFARLSDNSEVKKLFFTYAVEEEELDDLSEGLWNLSPNFKKVWNKLEEYSITHPGYFKDRRDDFYSAIDNLSEEGVFEIPAEYCEDPENCTEAEAERFINDFLDAIGNMGKLRLYYADLREDLAQENNICCICNEPYEGYGNNAEPVCSGRCCDKCNIERVIPMRFKLMNEDVDKVSYYQAKINNASSWEELQEISNEIKNDSMLTADEEYNLRFDVAEKNRQFNESKELNEGNPVSDKIPESIDSFLQDIAQMYGTIDYGDIMDHDYSEEDIKKLRSLRRKFREEAQYEGSEEAEAAMNDVAEKVAAILKAKNEALLETDESGNDEIEVNCDGEDCAELITISVDAEGPHYCCSCAPKYMKQENESLTEEKNSEKLFRKFPELRKLVSEEVEEVITEALADGTYKLTYYLATATRERRPETAEDVRNDWKVETFHSGNDYDALKHAVGISCMTSVDYVEDDCDIYDLDSAVEYLNGADWGDGSPIIIKLEGPHSVIYDTGYTHEDFIQQHKENDEYLQKMIDEMEKYDPDTAEQWKKVFGFVESFEPECVNCDEEEVLEDVDDSYDFDDMDEMLTEDKEIKRLRHIYGVG